MVNHRHDLSSASYRHCANSSCTHESKLSVFSPSAFLSFLFFTSVILFFSLLFILWLALDLLIMFSLLVVQHRLFRTDRTLLKLSLIDDVTRSFAWLHTQWHCSLPLFLELTLSISDFWQTSLMRERQGSFTLHLLIARSHPRVVLCLLSRRVIDLIIEAITEQFRGWLALKRKKWLFHGY